MKSPYLKLLAGLVVLAALILVTGFLPAPRGVPGEVVRHNLKEKIDASPLFYCEVEGIFQMDKDVARMHAEAVRVRSRVRRETGQ